MISYGVDPVKNFRQGAALVAKVLRGAKPAELPPNCRRSSSLSST
jgi:hypothetical protein